MKEVIKVFVQVLRETPAKQVKINISTKKIKKIVYIGEVSV